MPIGPEYWLTLMALAAASALLFVQLLVADIAGIRAKHPPGAPVPVDVSRFHFRATRAHLNTNESIVVFVSLALVGLLVGAPAGWLNGLSWTYVIARSAHMIFYYLNIATARSIAFAVSLVALAGMLVVVLATLA